MSGPFGVDTERLGKTASDAESLAARLDRIYNTLHNATLSAGNCWGADETGKAFEKNYDKNSKDVLRAMREMGEVVRSMGDGVNTMAKGFRRTEQGAVASAEQVTKRARGA
ncbi:WXG100 family type VII secretion target [Amycolatopsis sp. NPDC049868]|uniref:WXG100 family type VII secretion target n=1 Tax=Amycolatopsis sp. NPDC049868 TaxID=3363934 RepID=UPI0037AA0129